MPGINVSALSGGDLRRLLKVAHARHDGLLADRLEWEIAARATSGGHHAGPFATLPDDDPEDEPDDRMPNSDPEPFTMEPEAREHTAREPTAREPTERGHSVLLVTLGAVAGSLLSASVFWGLGRMDGLPALGRAQPTRTAPPTEPRVDRTVAVLTPETLPLRADSIAPAAMVEPPRPAVTRPPEVTRKSVSASKAHKKPAPTKAATHRTPAPTQVAERAGRPPTLSEWLANSKSEEPIH